MNAIRFPKIKIPHPDCGSRRQDEGELRASAQSLANCLIAEFGAELNANKLNAELDLALDVDNQVQVDRNGLMIQLGRAEM
jgi:hypothetical protein